MARDFDRDAHAYAAEAAAYAATAASSIARGLEARGRGRITRSYFSAAAQALRDADVNLTRALINLEMSEEQQGIRPLPDTSEAPNGK